MDIGKKTSKAMRDKNISDDITDVKYLDWKITTLFYSLLHYVDLYLYDKHGIDPTISDYNHRERMRNIRDFKKNIYSKYLNMYDESIIARYKPEFFTLTETRFKKMLTTYYNILSELGYSGNKQIKTNDS